MKIRIWKMSSFHPHNHHLSPNIPRLMVLFVNDATVNKVYLILSAFCTVVISTTLGGANDHKVVAPHLFQWMLDCNSYAELEIDILTIFLSMAALEVVILTTSDAASDENFMMTSSNGNIFRVTGPLCGQFTGDRWLPLTKASEAERWCFLWPVRE